MSHLAKRLRALLALPVAAVTLITGTGVAAASPSSTPQATAKVDCLVYDNTGTKCEMAGVVYATTQVAGLTYIGGKFASVDGTPRSNVAAIRTDGTLDPVWNPSTDGIVYALAASSDGSKVFLGGTFTTVGETSHPRIAAVTPDTGALVPDWDTTANTNAVRALAADSGDRLYVGGNFGRIGGKAIPRLALVGQATGAVDTQFIPNPNGTIRALALPDDSSRVYAGGGFSVIGGAARPGAAELDTASGSATSFAPTDGGVVISMDVAPNGRLFFGTTSNRTWAYDPADGGAPEYRVRTGGDVQAILAMDDEVYIGGHFNTLPESKLNRVALASFLPENGTVTPWNPGANGPFGVWALGLTRTPLSPAEPAALSIGGDFTRVGGVARRGYTRFLF